MAARQSRRTPLARAIEERVEGAFAPAGDPVRATAMAAYMRDQFPFLGIPSPQRVVLSRTATAGLPQPMPRDLESVATALWRRDEREYQYFATWYLRRHVKTLDGSFLETARMLITTKSWWDTVDELAQNVVGPVVLADRSLDIVMDAWIAGADLWLARTALLHQNRWRVRTDRDRLFRFCELRAGDRDFFIRKAIGWALREYSRVDGVGVRRFVADHDELSGLSRREALKWLDRSAAQTGS